MVDTDFPCRDVHSSEFSHSYMRVRIRQQNHTPDSGELFLSFFIEFEVIIFNLRMSRRPLNSGNVTTGEKKTNPEQWQSQLWQHSQNANDLKSDFWYLCN